MAVCTRVTIDPITRLEGHGKIEVFLNAEGNVEQAYLQIPELRVLKSFVKEDLLRKWLELPRVFAEFVLSHTIWLQRKL